MSQAASNFFTVTVTVTTNSAVPTMNATQKHELNESKQTGQIVALVVLGLFVFLALMLLLCWSVLCCRRPRPQPMTENQDAIRHGRGAFLPIIGRGKRKSEVGLEAARGGGSQSANSRSSFISHNVAPRGRRLSMWADEANTSVEPIPSPPILPTHSRSTSSTDSIERFDPHRTVSDASSRSIYSAVPIGAHGHREAYHDNAAGMESIPLEEQPMMPPTVPPKISRHDRGLQRGEHSSYGFEGREISPVVSPLEDMRPGMIRYPQHGRMDRTYDSGIYA